MPFTPSDALSLYFFGIIGKEKFTKEVLIPQKENCPWQNFFVFFFFYNLLLLLFFFCYFFFSCVPRVRMARIFSKNYFRLLFIRVQNEVSHLCTLILLLFRRPCAASVFNHFLPKGLSLSPLFPYARIL